MQKFFGRLALMAFAMWLTTLIVADGVQVVPYASDTLAVVLTYLLVALIFGFVNSVVGNFIRIVAFPLYILTLGLIALVVNSLLLLLVSAISSVIGFGLVVNGFWWGVLTSIVLGLISWVLGIMFRPLVKPRPTA
jgi:putative membrane protein